MIVSYLRSSSFNSHEFCPQQFYLDYVLGIKEDPNIKTVKGTIVHRVLEAIANTKIVDQEDGYFYEDKIAGKVQLLRSDCPPRVIVHDLESIVERCYDHFAAKHTIFDWSIEDYNDCLLWTNKVLSDTTISPLYRNVLEAERKFDFPVKREWANFRYEADEVPAWTGTLEGQLGIKGTIDLITEDEPGVIEVIDWKTGRRYDWGKKVVKDYYKLKQDPQLRIYHYVMKQLYPDKQVLITIYFINDGGAFTVPFDDRDMAETEEMLKEKFLHIKRTIRPQLHKAWHCTKFCYFGRHNMIGKRTTDEQNTICAHIHREIMSKGINQVTQEYTVPGFSLNSYTQGE